MVVPGSKSRSLDNPREVPVAAAFSPIPMNGTRSLIWPRRPHVVASVLMGTRLGHPASIQRQGFPTPQTRMLRCGGDEKPNLWASRRCNGAKTHIHKAESSDGLAGCLELRLNTAPYAFQRCVRASLAERKSHLR